MLLLLHHCYYQAEKPGAHLVLRRCYVETHVHGLNQLLHTVLKAEQGAQLHAEDVAVVAMIHSMHRRPSATCAQPALNIVTVSGLAQVHLARCSVQAARCDLDDDAPPNMEEITAESERLSLLFSLQGGRMQLEGCRLDGAQVHAIGGGSHVSMARCLLAGSRSYAAKVISAQLTATGCHFTANPMGVHVSRINM